MAECPTCGDSFETVAGMKRHHALAHDESIAGVEVECVVCGETVRKRPHEVEDYEHNVCSEDCRQSLVSDLSSDESNPNYKGGKSVYECHHCGETIQRYESTVPNPDRVFCGRECTAEWLRETTEFEGASHPRYNQVEVTCDYCGETFTRTLSNDTWEGTFCSVECKDAAHSDAMSGTDNPNWQHGESDTHTYGSEWEQTRTDVLDRDGHECVICGLSNEAHKRSYQGGLQIHHIEPIAEFETPVEANRLDNLITLCSRCHGRVEHGNTELRNKLAVVVRARTDA